MGASNSSARPPGPAGGKRRITLILAGVAIVTGAYFAWPERAAEPNPIRETRMPITNPVLESDRPDLLGSPHESPPPE